MESTGRKLLVILLLGMVFSCQENQGIKKEETVLWRPYNDSAEVAANQGHESERMRYKRLQSKVLDKNEIFLPLYHEVSQMSEQQYQALKPLILEQPIFTLRQHLEEKRLTYEQLTLFYLFRIYKYELDNATTLNTIVALNENVVDQARHLDALVAKGKEPKIKHPIYGMPILLKDNINTAGMNTTAGAIALMDNEVDDAFIVKRLKENGALILGKVNLSEWANFLCDCPNGQSAVGGQTLNPYGRRVFDTGGSSAGSGTSMAANYAVAAVGTETSGSILSPSGQNSVVGLKPTVGLLSRTGIVPISSTLDTPGPMTKNVADNAILLSAMLGKDDKDPVTVHAEPGILSAPQQPTPFNEMRLGAIKELLENDSIYRATIANLRGLGATIIEFAPPEVVLEGFRTLLSADMKKDLIAYLTDHSDSNLVKVRSVADVVSFNRMDSLVRIPYGQHLFEGIVADTTTAEQLDTIKQNLQESGRSFFDTAMDVEKLDAVVSVNNRHAGYAAVAKYPALTVPMAYKASGEPVNLTFIGKPFKEADLLRLGAAYEKAFSVRKMPEDYD